MKKCRRHSFNGVQNNKPKRRIWHFILISIIAQISCTHAAPLRVGGWVSYWDFEQSMRSMRVASGLSDVFLFVAMLNSAGHTVLAGPAESYQQAVQEIRAAEALPWLTVVNDLQDSRTLKSATKVHELLIDADARAAHRHEIVALAQALGVAGVDIDYENLNPEDRDVFSAFVQELSADLHTIGMLLSVTVQPKRGNVRSIGPGAADWRAVCQHADRLQIMLYNEHSGRTGAGPVATIPWIRAVMTYAASQCPVRRLVPAFKVIGMDWGNASFREVPFQHAMLSATMHKAKIARHGDDDVPTFSYLDAATQEAHTVFFEDAASLYKKFQAVAAFKVPSVVLWNLSREDPDIWRLISAAAQAAPK